MTNGWRDLLLRVLRARFALRQPRSTARPVRTLRLQATQEGAPSAKAWIKNALDDVIQSCMNLSPTLEFVWVGDDAIDPRRSTSGVGGDQDARRGAG